MRKVFYELTDGTKTTSYTKAKESGRPFKTRVESISAKEREMPPLQKEMLETYGYAHQSLAKNF